MPHGLNCYRLKRTCQACRRLAQPAGRAHPSEIIGAYPCSSVVTNSPLRASSAPRRLRGCISLNPALRAPRAGGAAPQIPKSPKEKFFPPAPHPKPHSPKTRCAPAHFSAHRPRRYRGTINSGHSAPSESNAHELQPLDPYHGLPARVNDFGAPAPPQFPIPQPPK